MDVVDLLLIAIPLVGGLILIVLGARMLLRGEVVTAEEAVKWRHLAKTVRFNAKKE